VCPSTVAENRWKGGREGGICTAAEKSGIPVRLFAKRSQRPARAALSLFHASVLPDLSRLGSRKGIVEHAATYDSRFVCFLAEIPVSHDAECISHHSHAALDFQVAPSQVARDWTLLRKKVRSCLLREAAFHLKIVSETSIDRCDAK